MTASTSPRRSPRAPAPPGGRSSPALGVATGLVRAWTHFYTWRVGPALRDARRAEIESDLFEFQQDPERGKYAAAHVLARLVIGIPDDLSWRAEQSSSARRTPWRARLRFVAWTVATVIVAAALWILPLMTASVLPPLPDKPRVVIKAPPPPPPPPPPCAPAGFPQSGGPCTP